MGTILIDKLLSDCVKQGGSSLFIETDQCPSALIKGKRRSIDVSRLPPSEVELVVREITPRDRLIELKRIGNTQFNFGFGDVARICASVRRDALGRPSVELEVK
ncbi:MAG TPA: hypothetical protein VHU84_06120 [Lacipirellulaceae bacterium]|nr:hypothetical protein [Lacipirellulaceae bacterium]